MQKRFRRVTTWLLDFYLFGNFHIGICAVALVLVTRDLFGLELRSELLVFTFCGTFCGYTIQRLPAAFASVKIERKFLRHRWNTDNRKLLAVVSVIAAGAASWAFMKLMPRTQMLAILPAFLSFAYAFPVIPLGKKWIRLREIPAAKIFLIAIVWTMSCAIIPVAASTNAAEHWFTLPVAFWSIACGLMIFAITVPFDIRDMYYDGEKLSTIPSLLGLQKSIRLAIAALVIATLFVAVLYYPFYTITLKQLVAWSLWSALTAFAIRRSKPERHEYFFSLLMDGMLILLWIMIRAVK
jgi:hypothetical protein